jgi:hypothetical protein
MILHEGKHLPDIRDARSGRQTCGLVPERPVRSGPCAGCAIRWRAPGWLVRGKAASLSRGLTAEAGSAGSAWIAAFRGILMLGNVTQLEPAAERRGTGTAVLARAGRVGPRGSSAYADAR